MKQNKKKVKKGFTLVELIVVIAIIGVLAMMITPSIMGYVNKAKINKNASNAKAIAMSAQTVNADLTVPLKSANADVPVTVVFDNGAWGITPVSAEGTKFCEELTKLIKVDSGAVAEINIDNEGTVTLVKYRGKDVAGYPTFTTGSVANEGGAVWVR